MSGNLVGERVMRCGLLGFCMLLAEAAAGAEASGRLQVMVRIEPSTLIVVADDGSVSLRQANLPAGEQTSFLTVAEPSAVAGSVRSNPTSTMVRRSSSSRSSLQASPPRKRHHLGVPLRGKKGRISPQP